MVEGVVTFGRTILTSASQPSLLDLWGGLGLRRIYAPLPTSPPAATATQLQMQTIGLTAEAEETQMIRTLRGIWLYSERVPFVHSMSSRR